MSYMNNDKKRSDINSSSNNIITVILMELDPRLHFVVATCIIVKGDRFLIAKRAPHEKAFPNKWTVPGGKLVLTEYKHLPKTSPSHPQWYGVLDWVLKKEVKEETGLDVAEPSLIDVVDNVELDADGRVKYHFVIVDYLVKVEGGVAKAASDADDLKWVAFGEVETYDLTASFRLFFQRNRQMLENLSSSP